MITRSARTTFLHRRNVVLAVFMGPILTFGSIALGVPDQGFDSLAGVSGFVIVALFSAGVSASVFLLAALLGNWIFYLIRNWFPVALAMCGARILVSACVATAYYFSFRLPTVKFQLFAMVLLAFVAALCLLRMEPVRSSAKPT